MVWKKCLLKETENTEAVSKNVLFLFVYCCGDHGEVIVPHTIAFFLPKVL